MGSLEHGYSGNLFKVAPGAHAPLPPLVSALLSRTVFVCELTLNAAVQGITGGKYHVNCWFLRY